VGHLIVRCMWYFFDSYRTPNPLYDSENDPVAQWYEEEIDDIFHGRGCYIEEPGSSPLDKPNLQRFLLHRLRHVETIGAPAPPKCLAEELARCAWPVWRPPVRLLRHGLVGKLRIVYARWIVYHPADFIIGLSI
jgi:hypothetical protein